MDVSFDFFLDVSSTSVNLIVRALNVADFPFLTSLASSENSKDRKIWLRVAADHFRAMEPRDADVIDAFAETMIPQLQTADSETRFEIACRLADCPRTPLRLLSVLAQSDANAGEHLLRNAVAYDRDGLVEAAAQGGRGAQAVAGRPDLDEALVRVLAASADIDVLTSLARNQAAPLDRETLFRLLRLARAEVEERGDRRLADALLERRPVEPETAMLFLQASPDQRVELLLAAQRAQFGRPSAGAQPQSSAIEELEMAAVARIPRQFASVLAQALGCSRSLAEAIIGDESGEPLAVALAALGAPNEVLVRVLISNDLLSGGTYRRIRSLSRLRNALNRAAAATVISALCDGGGALRPEWEPGATNAIPPQGRVPLARRPSRASSLDRAATPNAHRAASPNRSGLADDAALAKQR